MSARLTTGVVGVGSMGRHHARVYSELPNTDLVGVTDADEVRAREVASEHDTVAMDWDELRAEADAISIAVPTQYHEDLVRDCIEDGIPVLVEKPFVKNVDRGRDLLRLAAEKGVPIQVGHVERFNPAVRALSEYVRDLDVIAVTAQRLNPPLDRSIDDSAIFDLMIHDLDILLSLVDSDVDAVSSMTTSGGRYATAEVKFADGTIGQLTASRVTQRRVRELTVTADEALVHVDYDEQSVEIHRQSTDGCATDQETVIERLPVGDDEPLKRELESFVTVARDGGDPVVTGEDGLRAVELSSRMDNQTRPLARRSDA